MIFEYCFIIDIYGNQRFEINGFNQSRVQKRETLSAERLHLSVYITVEQKPEALFPKLYFNVIEAFVLGDAMEIKHPPKL